MKHNHKTIAEMQERIGVVPDGFWGPKSIAACQRHLRGLMPKSNPWPASDERSLLAFYGEPGDESQLVTVDVSSYFMKYEGASVARMTCHRKVWESLARILAALRDSHCAYVLSHYDGCYNNRAMRGGTRPSLHARGAAVDFLSTNNGNRMAWPLGSSMPLEVMEIFAREGWLSAGAFWGRDAMHFQATQ